MDTIRRMDTSIASNILQQYEQNGYVYVPHGLVPFRQGMLILASCDNMIILMSLKPQSMVKIHFTQMMLWQRGPAPRRDNVDIILGRDKVLKPEIVN